MTQTKIYPESGVELTPFVAKYYDDIMNVASFGMYNRFIRKAVKDIGIKPSDSILDMGCGTGRNAALMLKYLGDEGTIIGVDVSAIMQQQFEKHFAHDKRVMFQQQRIDIPFDLNKKFDIVFISFVLHGFPHEVRSTIIDNAKTHLKTGGYFVILDFSEFDMDKMPVLHRFIFKKIECPYAFDFIQRDWKKILETKNLSTQKEWLYFLKYVRLLKTQLK